MPGSAHANDRRHACRPCRVSEVEHLARQLALKADVQAVQADAIAASSTGRPKR